jgi:hypothetical protein
MQATMTPRQEHASNLGYIQELSGDNYYRKMTFKEADEWLLCYDHYKSEGYPHDMAVMYAWDCYFAGRRTNV